MTSQAENPGFFYRLEHVVHDVRDASFTMALSMFLGIMLTTYVVEPVATDAEALLALIVVTALMMVIVWRVLRAKPQLKQLCLWSGIFGCACIVLRVSSDLVGIFALMLILLSLQASVIVLSRQAHRWIGNLGRSRDE